MDTADAHANVTCSSTCLLTGRGRRPFPRGLRVRHVLDRLDPLDEEARQIPFSALIRRCAGQRPDVPRGRAQVGS